MGTQVFIGNNLKGEKMINDKVTNEERDIHEIGIDYNAFVVDSLMSFKDNQERKCTQIAK